MYIAPIVEGRGEDEAVPALLHRIALAAGYPKSLRVNRPIRVKAGSFLSDDDYLARYVGLAAAKASQHRGSVLILLDCDDGCPAEVGPRLLERASRVRADVAVLVCLAHREYESWFLAAAHSLAGLRGIDPGIEPPRSSESVRDAKGWLRKQMESPYDPLTHQAEFTRAFDLEAARKNGSFDRLYRRLGRLFMGDA